MPELLIASLMVAIIAGIVDLDSTATWQFMISQPIVAAPLTGLCLGGMFGQTEAGLKLGLMVGTILQLVWVEHMPLGMNVPPDAALASVLSVALGFIAGQNFSGYAEKEVCYTIALLLSVALGLLGRSLDMFVRRLNTNLDSWVTKQLISGKLWSLSIGHILGGFFTFAKTFIFCFLIVWLGVEPLRYFTQTLSFNHASGFIVIQGLLPAIGFSVLASMCLQSKTEKRNFVLGILIFTVLPANMWFAFAAPAIILIRSFGEKNAKAK